MTLVENVLKRIDTMLLQPEPDEQLDLGAASLWLNMELQSQDMHPITERRRLMLSWTGEQFEGEVVLTVIRTGTIAHGAVFFNNDDVPTARFIPKLNRYDVVPGAKCRITYSMRFGDSTNDWGV